MADLSDVWKNDERNKAIIRAELDQRKQDCWELLHSRGSEWTVKFAELLNDFRQTPETDIDSAILQLANIGYLHMMESSIY